MKNADNELKVNIKKCFLFSFIHDTIVYLRNGLFNESNVVILNGSEAKRRENVPN